MVILKYCEEGKAIGDFGLDAFRNKVLKALKSTKDTTLKISNELPILMVRVSILKKEIDPLRIVIMFDNQCILFDERGALDDYPTGFCDTEEKLLATLCGWGNTNETVNT